MRVVREGEGYYLTSSLMDSPPDGKQFYEIAPDLLTRANGLGRVHNPSFRPVTLAMNFDDGDHVHHVVLADTVEARSKLRAVAVVTSADGEPMPQPPPPSPRHASVGSRDADVTQALAIMGQPAPLGWVELYKIYEIVKASGALPPARDAAGLTDADLSRFTHTANHPDASGDDSRHARSAQQPPRTPMPIEQARDLASRLVRAWIELHT